MTNYKLENGLLFMEKENGFVIPAMNEDTSDIIELEEKVSPFVYEEIIGDFVLSGKFMPKHMSFTDAFGIYIMNDEKYGYVKVDGYNGVSSVKSGIFDLFEMENPSESVGSEDIYLKLERRGNDFVSYYSTDGVNYTECGGFEFEAEKVKVGFMVSSFQGSQFLVEVTSIHREMKARKNVA